MKPKVSVIIPVYNGMPFLPETVDSILNQTVKDFQLVIINDGSTDESASYLDTLKDPRVVIKHQSNMGLCASLNQAIQAADADIIARLDQDDVALPHRLEEQLSFLEKNPNYDGVLSNISRISENGREFGAYRLNQTEPISDYSSKIYGCIVHSTLCMKKEVLLSLGGYRQSVYPVDDYDLLLRMEDQCKLAVINSPLVKYRIHSQSGTFQSFRNMELKTRYVQKLAELRRAGKEEISLADFEQTVDRRGWIQNVRRYLKGVGKISFRKAGLRIGNAQYLYGALNLMIACLLCPSFTFKRLRSLYLPKGIS